MNKTVALLASTIILTSTTAYADAFDFHIGARVWDMASEGSVSDGKITGKTDEFDFFDETQNHFYIALEHPIPLIPNMKVTYSEMVTSGKEKFPVAGALLAESELDFSYTDFTLYYQLVDNDSFGLDFGVTARNFEGEFETRKELGVKEEIVDDYLPMVYLATNIGLPINGLSIFAEGNAVIFEDHTFADYQMGVSYVLIDSNVLDISLQAGYQSVKLELEDLDGVYTDLDFDGAFAGVDIHF